MSEWDEFQEWRREEDERALTPKGIAEENRLQLRRYREFRLAADAIAAVWRRRGEVSAIALIGSLASAPFKEVPRFQPYRREGIALWHECKDLDLALWLDGPSDLNALRRDKSKALSDFFKETGCGVADHQADVFVLEPGSNRYLGRLCGFNRCPKGHRDCLTPGCGATPFLKQHEGFQWRRESLDRMLMLFDRAGGISARAADLSLP